MSAMSPLDSWAIRLWRFPPHRQPQSDLIIEIIGEKSGVVAMATELDQHQHHQTFIKTHRTSRTLQAKDSKVQ